MASERLIALIHADIDGELDAAGREELGRGLRADPQAASLHSDLVRVARLLDGMSPPDAGPLLQARLLAALPAGAPPPTVLTHADLPARRRAGLRWPTRRSNVPGNPTNLFGGGPYTNQSRSKEHVPDVAVQAAKPSYHRGNSEMSKNRIYALAALAALLFRPVSRTTEDQLRLDIS